MQRHPAHVQCDTRCNDDGNRPGLILVVDPDSGIRQLISIVLEKAGYTVLTGGTAREALQILQRTPCVVSLIISESRLPEMSSADFAAAAQRTMPDLGFLFMSGSPCPPELAALDFEFIPKPFILARLAENVHAALRRREMAGMVATPLRMTA